MRVYRPRHHQTDEHIKVFLPDFMTPPSKCFVRPEGRPVFRDLSEVEQKAVTLTLLAELEPEEHKHLTLSAPAACHSELHRNLVLKVQATCLHLYLYCILSQANFNRQLCCVIGQS